MLTEIKLKRLLSGISGKELSRRTQIERSRLCRLELGRLCPRADELRRIEQALAAGPRQDPPPEPPKELETARLLGPGV